MKAALAIMVLCVAACAAPEGEQAERRPSTGGDCFNVSMVTGYETVDRDTVRLRAGPSQEYDIDLEGGQCNTVEWSQRLAIESTPSSWVCVGDRVGQGEIYFREPATRRRISCHIGEVRRVSETAP